MTLAKKMMDNLYSKLQANVQQFREPAFVGRIELHVVADEGTGYKAEIKCPRGAGLLLGQIQQVRKAS